MSRHDRRALEREQHAHVAQFPEALTLIPPSEYPVNFQPDRAWKSRKFLVQLFVRQSKTYPDCVRLSVCRTQLKGERWKDGISWDDLQAIKRELGYGSWYGVEIYPPDSQVVNVANFRHLWLMPTPLDIGWLR